MRNLASPQRYLKHGSPTTSDNTLTFDWSDVSDPSGVTYYLQIDNDVDFSSPAISENGLTLSTYTLTSGEALSEQRGRLVGCVDAESSDGASKAIPVGTRGGNNRCDLNRHRGNTPLQTEARRVNDGQKME